MNYAWGQFPTLQKIRVHYSDGRPTMRPPPEDCVQKFNPDGSYEYFQEAKPGDPYYQRVLRECGEYLAQQVQSLQPSLCVLDDIPEGYSVYGHRVKGVGKDERTDRYIFGHPTGGRYRSPNEFKVHVLWLASNEEHDYDDCPCKCCKAAMK
ncbi:hypothetical protein G7K_0953-t1 [Saitoella complicata NRRL Y-17804]|uniref:Cryptic loci regulator 2 N-terminal domain-containing protein n=1 Tax=Saitoella complicata (strain BCRC 22490 / CBS 7301 / JCM 7358 / NBRC 10748 / NRRL Y-17804) TaxID=698492 RepID=A0A0E9NAJ1_SAICN|nr:hypothetical protein G7K_0953-t1 [Saitoella complicata NRRL Y-17804]